MYYLKTRYYDPEVGRFVSIDDLAYLVPDHINGMNLYAYCYNNHVMYVDSIGRSPVNNICSQSVAAVEPSNSTSINTSAKSFLVGAVTPKNSDLPSWASVYFLYVKGSAGWNYSADNGYSILSFGIGLIDTKFHTPKWFSSLSNDNFFNPNIYFGLGAWNANISVGVGFSATVEIISASVGIQMGNSLSVEAKVYAGFGVKVDLSNGFKVNFAFLYGFEISINFDWGKIFSFFRRL